jgi:hypothetical protein
MEPDAIAAKTAIGTSPWKIQMDVKVNTFLQTFNFI